MDPSLGLVLPTTAIGQGQLVLGACTIRGRCGVADQCSLMEEPARGLLPPTSATGTGQVVMGACTAGDLWGHRTRGQRSRLRVCCQQQYRAEEALVVVSELLEHQAPSPTWSCSRQPGPPPPNYPAPPKVNLLKCNNTPPSQQGMPPPSLTCRRKACHPVVAAQPPSFAGTSCSTSGSQVMFSNAPPWLHSLPPILLI